MYIRHHHFRMLTIAQIRLHLKKGDWMTSLEPTCLLARPYPSSLPEVPGLSGRERSVLQKALFLIALASGLRSSQLKALTRFPPWTSFAEDDSRVSLAPSANFLAKNEREDHRLHAISDGFVLASSRIFASVVLVPCCRSKEIRGCH